MKNSGLIKIISLSTILVTVFLLSSCLNTDDEAAAEQAKINEYIKANGFTDAHKKPSGIYIKFKDEAGRVFNDSLSPKPGQTCIITFTGKTTDGEILETTDSVIGKIEFPDLYFVYGPFRIKKGNTKIGIDTALYYFNPGDEATIVLPSDWANFDFEPVVYDLKLLEIISNDSAYNDLTYEHKTFMYFLGTNNFDTINPPDTFSKNFYFKGSLNPNPFKFDNKDFAIINLTARYAENYYPDNSGRIFYPLLDAPLKLKRKFEDAYYFPFIPAIDTALRHMAAGDVLEIAVNSSYAYSNIGFNHPRNGLSIIPPYMPVHYRIELVSVEDH